MAADPNGPTVALRDVCHSFGEGEHRKQVLFDVGLELMPGEIVIMTGPSGSGKTTLLTLIGALRSLQQGSIRVHGRELAGLSQRERVEVRRRVGFIFQAHNLFASLTALQNVYLSLELDVSTAQDKRRQAVDVLTRIGLGDLLGSKPDKLSGGQRQRVAIARALAHRPPLLLADEPTAALDKDTGREVVDLFRELADEQRCTVLLVTHDPRILGVADRIVNLVDGAIVSNVLVQQSIEICEFLSRLELFAMHSPDTLNEIAQKMRVERHAAGTEIFRQGDAGERFYVIRSGEVEVIVVDDRGTRTAATLGGAEIFGEAALLTDKPRNATIRVRQDVELYTLDRPEFKTAVEASKSFRQQLLDVFLTRQ